MRLNPRLYQFYSMNGTGVCALAAVRSVLKSQFNIYRKESTLIKQVAKYIRHYTLSGSRFEGSISDFFNDFGLGPDGIAYLLELNFNQSREYEDDKIKIFSSRRGSIKTLDMLVSNNIIPIFHQLVLYPEEKEKGNKPEGHYMLYGRSDGNYVWYFDVSKGEGWKKIPKSVFSRQWKNPKADNEKWYLAAISQSYYEYLREKEKENNIRLLPQNVKYYQPFFDTI